MRYYIYIDKPLLRSLYSVQANIDLNLEILEYSSKKTIGSVVNVGYDPSFENVEGFEKISEFKEKEELKKEEEERYFKKIDSNRYVKREEFNLNNSKRKEDSFERKCINIEDVSSIHNNNFYHRILEKMYSSSSRSDDRLYRQSGRVALFEPRNIDNNYFGSNEESKEVFLKLKEDYIWVEKEKVTCNMNVICSTVENVEILGYTMNNKEGSKVVKCVAMYIE